MDNEVLFLAKGLPTLITFKRFLSAMDVLMFKEVLLLAKGSSTLITLKWLLSCVNFLMFFEICFAIKSFPTFLTRKWFFPRAPLISEGGCHLNGRLLAVIGVLFSMLLLRRKEASSLAEGFSTFV